MKQHQRARAYLNIVMSMNKGKEDQALQVLSKRLTMSHGVRKEAAKMLKERAYEVAGKGK
jgi:hypothetical protein